MTKAELKERLLNGEILDELFHFRFGQDCLIFKADRFEPGDQIIYIPDTTLNECCPDEPITDPEELEQAIDCCYTGDDFVNECEGDVALAEDLFWYCDWQHPSSAYPEVYDSYKEDKE